MGDANSAEDAPSVAVAATFADFYDAHYQRIARALSMAVGDPVLGQEATDEAMTRAVTRWDRLAHTSNPAGWVYTVGLNWARSASGRASRLAKRMVSRDGRPKLTKLPADIDPELWNAVQALNVDLRSVLVCRVVADWSTRDTAEALGIAEGTVKTRLARALRELRTELGDPTTESPQETDDRGGQGEEDRQDGQDEGGQR